MSFLLYKYKFYYQVGILTALFSLLLLNVKAQQKPDADKQPPADTSHAAKAVPDSLHTKAAQPEVINLPVSKSALSSEVKYTAKDSIIFDVAAKKVYLYGNAKINYTEIELKADVVNINWSTSVITAKGRKDSTGKMTKPEFIEKGVSYKVDDSMSYNFKTKRGIVRGLRTKEGDGNIIVDKGKYFQEDSVNIIYAKDAKYTTCDLDDPHYYILARKIKIIPKDKIISGSSQMKIADVPMPLLIPFGFFPANSKRSSGLIFPLYGEDANGGGFFLKQGGYYFGLSDYFDLKLTGDIYANGGYGGNVLTHYAKRYQSSGSLSFGLSRLKLGLEDTKEFQTSKLYSFGWQHAQDPKSLPGFNFSSSVNLSSAKYDRLTSTDVNKRLTSNLNSSIQLSKKFAGTPFTLSANLQHNQNNQTKIVTMSLPSLTLNMERIYPFKSQHGDIVKNHWYDQIGLNYSADFRNQINTFDSLLFKATTYQNPESFKKGFQQQSSLSTSFKALGSHLSITPSINYRGYLYFDRTYQYASNITRRNEEYTEKGIFYSNDLSFNTSLSTNIYGMYQFRGKVEAIRHLMTPNLTFNYTPDFRKAPFNYFARAYGDTTKNLYSKYKNGIFGAPGIGHFAGMNFGLNNNLEMKVKVKKDTGFTSKKIKLIENLNLTGGYNFIADSQRLSTFSISAYNTFFEKINVNVATQVDPYKYRFGRRTAEYAWSDGFSLGHIPDARLALSTSLNPKAQKSEAKMRAEDPRLKYYYPGTYVDFNAPWNLAINYTVAYSNKWVAAKQRWKDTISGQDIGLNGGLQITTTWKINFTTFYSFSAKKIGTTSIDIYKDLHCWEMRFNWVPFGDFRSYYFTINIKSASLKDLKYDKKKSYQQYR